MFWFNLNQVKREDENNHCKGLRKLQIKGVRRKRKEYKKRSLYS